MSAVARLITVYAAACVAACSGSRSPAAPSPATPAPAPKLWSVTGRVTEMFSGNVTNATLEITNGPDVRRQTKTNAAGEYSFEGLRDSVFDLIVYAPDLEQVNMTVDLRTGSVVDIRMIWDRGRLPHLADSGSATSISIGGSNSWTHFGEARNIGYGCGRNMTGIVELRTRIRELIASAPISFEPGIIVRPDQVIDYSACCFTDAQKAREDFYIARIDADPVHCPPKTTSTLQELFSRPSR